MAAITTHTVGGWYSATPGVAHEDLADICTILDSFQTPFFSSSPKIRARDVVHSWAIDTLMAPVTAGAIEVSAFSNAAAQTSPARLTNGTVIFRNDVEVSDREREVNPAGIRDMYEHQVMKCFKQIARDFESWAFATGQTAYLTGNITNAPSGYGFHGFATIVSNGPGAVTTANIILASEALFNAGAEPDSMWFAPPGKRQFVNATSGTGGFNVRNIAASDKALVANVDVFESPFNQLYAVITDRFIPTATASATGCAYFIGDRAMAKTAFLRAPQHKPMGKAGDSTRGIILMEATLQLDHPSAWCRITGVTNG